MRPFPLFGLSAEELADAFDYRDDTESIPIEFYKLSLIDEILGSFFEKRPVQGLLKKVSTYTVGGGVGISYKFKNVTYSGCLRARTRENETGDRSYVLVVHLSHDGFRYSRRQNSEVSAVHENWHDRGSWQSLTQDFLKSQHLQRLVELMTASGSTKVDFRYNYPHKRIDILFFRGEDEHFMTVCFEHGAPEGTDKAKYAVELK